tara:strand:- start:489 stop:887 length:399 start_codon:yes stop_codon:yes gene_type:complete
MKHVTVRYHDDTSKRTSSDWQFCYDWMLDANAEREYTDHEVLDIVWEQWNAGSGHESKQFLNLNVRSMMVGDYINVDGVWHECLPLGWRINVSWEEVMGTIPKKDMSDVTEKVIKEALMKQLSSDNEISLSA